jgi:hypothetical protein
MKNFTQLIVVLTGVLFMVSCKPKEIPLNIINLSKAQGLRNYSNIYSLPKTVIRVRVTAERLNYARGPYYQYAQTYLGLEDVIQENKQEWRISDVDFETYPIADTNNLFLIETNDQNKLLQFNFNQDGFLESINEIEKIGNGLQQYTPSYKEPEVAIEEPFNEILAKANTELSFDDVPVPKEIVNKKSLGEQAAAFANRILTLRDDRAALLVGDGYTQALPVGETMKTMITGIDNIQEKYLSMFRGKIVKDSFSFTFDFVPDEPRKRTQSILFRFSEQNGIVDNSEISGMPIIIEIESYETLKQLEQFKKRQFYLEKVTLKNELEKGFYYRIPEMGVVRLIQDEKVLKQEQIQIAQYGSIQHLPFKYFDGTYTIKFFPEMGSLKSISLIEKEKTDKKDKRNK